MNFREREEFEQWLRHGHERGWLNRTGEEVRSWLGDTQDVDKRRMLEEFETFLRDRLARHDYQQHMQPTMRGDYDVYRRPTLTSTVLPGRMNMGEVYENQYRLQYGQNPLSPYNRVTNQDIAELEKLARLGEQSFNTPRSLQSYNEFSHCGRGPKGFQRSDEKILDEAHEVLTRHPEIDATDIEVAVKDGEVTLKGMVDNRWSKRLAEDLIDYIYGVKQVHNLIRVNKNESGFFLNNEEKQTRKDLATANRR